MEISIGQVTLHFPPLLFVVLAVAIITLLLKWSKQLEKRRYVVFLYFCISAINVNIFSYHANGNRVEIWVPLGFIAVILYLILGKKNHPAKLNASILGLCVALYFLGVRYSIF